ncbi:MAG: hypothetical protein R3E67_02905 [Pseudomonadales bacterium]
MHDTDKAIERFLQLQEQWKLIGITRHHEDRNQASPARCWQNHFDKRRDAQQQQRQAQDNILHKLKPSASVSPHCHTR